MSDAAAISPLAPSRTIGGRKFQSLDGLRAIAILAVFCHHMCEWIPSVNFPIAVTREYLWLGFTGVDLFFVLSGFLITGILLETREASNYFTGFYARRALRIFPLYYLVLTSIVVASQILTNSHAQSAPQIATLVPLPEDRWVYFSYLTNWIGLWKQPWGPNFASFVAHFWSLAVEEQFYLIWPLIVWLVRPRGIRRIAIVLFASSATIRLLWVLHTGPQNAIQFATVTRMDAIFVGAICANLYKNSTVIAKIRRWLPWIAGLGMGGSLFVFSLLIVFRQRAGLLLDGWGRTVTGAMIYLLQGGGYSILALGFGALVLLCAQSECRQTWGLRVLRSRFLGAIGKYSYGIYVFHIPVLRLMDVYVYKPYVRHNGIGAWIIAYLACATAITFLISALSYELFERRILGYKRFFEPRYAQPLPVAPVPNSSPAGIHVG